MNQMELRVLDTSISSSNDDCMTVEGLVNKTEDFSHVLGNKKKFREKIAKGTFAKALERAQRVDFLAEHKQDYLLATTENDSLELWEDEEGLKMRARIAPTSYGKDFYTLMSEKLISHMSFGFRVLKDTWKKGIDGIYERYVEEIELLEVSAVRNPAYPASAIAARGIDVIEDVSIPDEIEEDEMEERSINIEELKAVIKQEILNELAAKEEVQEVKEEPVVVEEKVEAVVEEVAETVQVEEKPVEEVAPAVEETVVTEEAKPEIEAETVEEVVKEDNQEHLNNALDLIKKYKEIQNLRG